MILLGKKSNMYIGLVGKPEAKRWIGRRENNNYSDPEKWGRRL